MQLPKKPLSSFGIPGFKGGPPRLRMRLRPPPNLLTKSRRLIMHVFAFSHQDRKEEERYERAYRIGPDFDIIDRAVFKMAYFANGIEITSYFDKS